MSDPSDTPTTGTGDTAQPAAPTRGGSPREAGRRPGGTVSVHRGLFVGSLLAAGLVGGLVGAGVLYGLSPADNRVCASTDVANQTLPSVVTVLTSGAGGAGNGTGQVFRSGGYILTNDHVISSAANSGTIRVQYTDGTTTDATIVGRDPATDLAVIKAADAAKDRPVIKLGSSALLQVGQPVVALGAPLGLSSTVTAGIISALGRYVSVPANAGPTAHIIDAVQTDASINPGNSGGPLVDCRGGLVGINTAIAVVPNETGVAGGGNVGVGFAIPVDLAGPIADQLISTGRAAHPDLGLAAQTLMVEGSRVPAGLYVTDVATGGPAQMAGVRVGDVIVGIQGEVARSTEQLVLQTLKNRVGDTVTLSIWRAGERIEAKVVLGEPPTQ